MAENNKDKLPHLASEIKSGLELAEKGKQDRIKGLVDAAVALREARSLIAADIRFNKWCTANEFGPDVLNAHDRAALIAMGVDPERMRSLLSNSERQSVRYIYQHEWSAAKSAGDADANTNADTIPMPIPIPMPTPMPLTILAILAVPMPMPVLAMMPAMRKLTPAPMLAILAILVMPMLRLLLILPKVGLTTRPNQEERNKNNNLKALAIRVAAIG
jgi:hypothetical protein